MTELFTRDGTARTAVGTDSKGRPFAMVRRPCTRCGGEGRSDKWAHTGYTCFDCGGSGRHIHGDGKATLYTAEQLAKLNATQAKAHATRAAKRQVAAEVREAAEAAAREDRRATVEASPLFQALAPFADRDSFVAEMVETLRTRDLSERQEEAALAACERITKRDAERAAARFVGYAGERITFAGVVSFVRCIRQPSYYEAGRYLIKIRLDDGASLTWFSGQERAEGERVEGTAKVKAHETYRDEPQTIITNPRFKAA